MTSTATANRRFATRLARRFITRPSPAALLDVALAAVMLAGSLLLLSHAARFGIAATHPGPGAGSRGLDLVGLALAACSTLPLVAWRRFPLGVFVVTAAVSALLAGLDYPVHLLLGPTAALYLLASTRKQQTRRMRRTAAAVAGLLVAYVGVVAASQGVFPGIEPLGLIGLAWTVAWLAGERTRLRREQLAELKQRAVRAERDAERERRLAAAEERARIARDLHDSAGHAISVIAVRAGAARLRHHTDPDRSLTALEAIEELARRTVAEIDQLVGTLRQGAGSASTTNGTVEAPLGLASLDTLLARHQAAGLKVTLDISGTPRPPGGAADQAAYRILQEALTNATRHGTGSARIRLAFGEAELQLSVTNPVPIHGLQRAGGGHGLIGMRERAVLLGGSLETERADGLFRLHARIPYRAGLQPGVRW